MNKFVPLIAVTVLIVFVITGCQTNTQPNAITQQPISSSEVEASSDSVLPAWKNKIYPAFGDTRWGMSPKEVFEALGTDEADWTQFDRTALDEEIKWDSVAIYKNDDLEIYGTRVQASLVFAKALDVGLIEVDITYSAAGDEQGEIIRQKLIETYGEANPQPTSISPRWNSAKVKDIYSNEAWNDGKLMMDYVNEINRLKKEAGEAVADEQINRFKAHNNEPLCFITDFKDNKSFVFSGLYAAILKWDGQIFN